MEQGAAKLSPVAHLISPSDAELYSSCLRLRHEYFVERRGWLARDDRNEGLEADIYDERALHFAVTLDSKISAYLRALPSDARAGFMLDREFSPLIDDRERASLIRHGALELSRLVCDSAPNSLSKKSPHPVEFLLRMLYQYSKKEGFGLYYVVVEESWLKPFERRFGLPFRIIGRPYTFPDGTRTVAAMATIPELEAGMRRHSREKYAWYQEAK